MQRVRLTLAALLPVLLVAFMFTACQDDDSPAINGGNGDGGQNDTEVTKVTLSVGRTALTDYYGKTDSIAVTATAKRADGTVVSDAVINISVIEGPGSIVYRDGNVSNEEGQVLAKLALPMENSDTTVVRAEVNHQTASQQIAATVADVLVSMSATPAVQEVVTGQQGVANLKIRVQNNLGVAVEGVPIKLKLISGLGTLTAPEYDSSIDAYTSSLTVDAVAQTVETRISATVNVGGEIVFGETNDGNGKVASDNGEGEEPVVFLPTGKGVREIAASDTADTIMVRMTPSSARVAEIFINADPNRLIVAPGESQTSNITLVAKDINSNGVKELKLHLRVRSMVEGGGIGSVSDPIETDDTGMSTAILSTNMQYGQWIIDACADTSFNVVFSDTVEVVTGSAQQIIVSSDTTRIAVYGTNGVESTQVRARVTDQNGNSVQDGTKVFFLLSRFPWEDGDEARIRLGESFGLTSPYVDPAHPASEYGLPFDSTTTNSGEAILPIQSGSRKGTLILQAWTYTNSTRTDSIIANYNGLQVVAGPAEFVEIDYDEEAVDGGGAVWMLQISTRVQDIMNNDVADSVQVLYTVEPEIAHVTDGFTGNAGLIDEVPQPGVAFSTLLYQSRFTHDTITLTASVRRGSDGFYATDTYELELPIQLPIATMSATPSNFNYTLHVPHNGYAEIEVTIHVRDGHTHLINNQVVHFSPQMGRIYSTNQLLPQNPQTPYAITGPADYDSVAPDDDPDGVCKRWLLITEDEAFPDPASPMNTCTIQAELYGEDDVTIEPVTIFLYR